MFKYKKNPLILLDKDDLRRLESSVLDKNLQKLVADLNIDKSLSSLVRFI